MKHQPPFQYYGSKASLAGWIVSNLPTHEVYIEPFAGSAAVLLAKPPSRYEVINDLNGDVVNFFRVLRDTHDELVALLQLTPYAKDEYLECRDGNSSELAPVERARRFFVRCNLAFNASTAKAGFSCGQMGRAKPRTFTKRIDERLAVVADRLRNVEIENVDALRLIDRWANAKAVLYLDPPYLNDTRKSKNDYATENGGADFHRELLDKISGFPGAVVLSGYDSPLYASLGWRKVEREVSAHTSNTAGVRRTECLWINR